MGPTADVIVVGAGSAGCAAAARLAQAGLRVLVLEAGHSDAHPLAKIPFGVVWLTGSKRDWRFRSAPLPSPHPLSSALGGFWRRLTSVAGARRRRFRGPGVADDDEIAAHIRARAATAYHPVGTVALGGPLDARAAVRGVEGLWVADASVVPRITSANTNAPSIMIGHRIGGSVECDLVKGA